MQPVVAGTDQTNASIISGATGGVSGSIAGDTRRVHIQNTLKTAILDGYFQAGQKPVERELCLLTGASRSIVREALAHLEAARETVLLLMARDIQGEEPVS